MRAYRREENGSLELVTVVWCDGQPWIDSNTPLFDTGNKVVLMGWPDDEAAAYESDSGTEYLLPEKGEQ